MTMILCRCDASRATLIAMPSRPEQHDASSRMAADQRCLAKGCLSAPSDLMDSLGLLDKLLSWQ